jgi:hypothetical protein
MKVAAAAISRPLDRDCSVARVPIGIFSSLARASWRASKKKSPFFHEKQ